MTNAFEVAKYFLSLSSAAGDTPRDPRRSISNKKLQKLLYYAWAWYYTRTSEKLFSERVEAWIHGPAVPPVYGLYKRFGFQSINADLSNFSPAAFSEREKFYMDEVWRVYGQFDADYLEALTHAELPWLEARSRGGDGSASNELIDPEVAKQFYGAMQMQH